MQYPSSNFSLNQFSPNSRAKGQLVTQVTNQVLDCSILSTSSDVFYGGTAVKFVADTSSTNGFVVAKCTITDESDGTIVFSTTRNTSVAGESVSVALSRSIIWCQASANVVPGALVESVPTTNTVIPSGGTNPVYGKALTGITVGSGGQSDMVAVLLKGSF